jgi:hypothetical protein
MDVKNVQKYGSFALVPSPFKTLPLQLYLLLFQDIVIVHCTPEHYSRQRVLAASRKALKSQGIMGLNKVPSFRYLLQRLPQLLQEQYQYEKVSVKACLYQA